MTQCGSTYVTEEGHFQESSSKDVGLLLVLNLQITAQHVDAAILDHTDEGSILGMTKCDLEQEIQGYFAAEFPTSRAYMFTDEFHPK